MSSLPPTLPRTPSAAPTSLTNLQTVGFKLSNAQAVHLARVLYINVALLPKGVNHKDLWKLEANLQFAKEFKQAYAGINELLKLRAGRAGGLSIIQIRDALGGRYTERKLQERFDVLELVDQYLEWLGKPKQYQIIEDDRSLERFNSLQAIVINQLKAEWGKDAKAKIPKLIIFAFELIKAGESHWDIRKLRDIAKTPKALDRILKPANDKPETKTSSSASRAAQPAAKKKVPAGEEVQKAFEEAKDIVAAHDEKNRPEKLLASALTYLRQIDLVSFSSLQGDLKALVDEIADLVAKLKASKIKKR